MFKRSVANHPSVTVTYAVFVPSDAFIVPPDARYIRSATTPRTDKTLASAVTCADDAPGIIEAIAVNDVEPSATVVLALKAVFVPLPPVVALVAGTVVPGGAYG